MPLSQRTHAFVWIVMFGLVAWSGSELMGGRGMWPLVLAGFVALAVMLAAGARLWTAANRTTPVGPRALAASDARDLIRMDSDKG